ncbi:cytochrome c oxidase assembly factor Coa1 family protein [Cytophagaceae bacterium ABcell3]|nr:cytochrome c oxidase assembly factor Coa1 family protein [Cytophagaceae bacterium ABcell3]
MAKASGNNKIVYTVASRKRRFLALLIDHFTITFFIVAASFMFTEQGQFDNDNINKTYGTLTFIFSIGLLFYFAKDSLKGISFGKWVLGIMVRRENDPLLAPSTIKLFVRNLMIVLWPVELLVLAFSKEKKRIGDKLAGTIVLNNPDKSQKLPRIIAVAGVGSVFFIFTLFFTAHTMKGSDAYKLAVQEIESNEDIIQVVGSIEGYGMLPAGNISITNGLGEAELQIKVIGSKKVLNIQVVLEKEPNEDWKLLDIQIIDE